MGGEQRQDASRPSALSHLDVVEQLPEYVAATLAGASPARRYPLVADHLTGCPTCRADLAELLVLTQAAYDDKDAPPLAYPAPDLSGLAPRA